MGNSLAVGRSREIHVEPKGDGISLIDSHQLVRYNQAFQSYVILCTCAYVLLVVNCDTFAKEWCQSRIRPNIRSVGAFLFTPTRLSHQWDNKQHNNHQYVYTLFCLFLSSLFVLLVGWLDEIDGILRSRPQNLQLNSTILTRIRQVKPSIQLPFTYDASVQSYAFTCSYTCNTASLHYVPSPVRWVCERERDKGTSGRWPIPSVYNRVSPAREPLSPSVNEAYTKVGCCHWYGSTSKSPHPHFHPHPTNFLCSLAHVHSLFSSSLIRWRRKCVATPFRTRS